MAEKPLLELSTLAPERPTIKIDGVLYEIATLDDFGLRDQEWIRSRGNRVRRLWFSEEELSDDEVLSLEQAVDGMIQRIVLRLPDEVLGKLKVLHKVRIMEVFSDAAGVKEPAATEAEATGERSSQLSSASTVETPGAG